MKAVILAAGIGKRLWPYTKELPKCLAIVLEGKTLLEWQLETLGACGISEICIVRGYQADRIQAPGVRYFFNAEYERTNVLASLFCAEDALEGDVLVSYSDIWYEPAIVRRLLECREEIVLAADFLWEGRYIGRTGHPVSEVEVVLTAPDGRVEQIGKIAPADPGGTAEFIGMMTLRSGGCETLKTAYHAAAARYRGKPYQRAQVFEQAYLTDLLQELADGGVRIDCVHAGGGWREIDTRQDLKHLQAEFERKAT